MHQHALATTIGVAMYRWVEPNHAAAQHTTFRGEIYELLHGKLIAESCINLAGINFD